MTARVESELIYLAEKFLELSYEEECIWENAAIVDISLSIILASTIVLAVEVILFKGDETNEASPVAELTQFRRIKEKSKTGWPRLNRNNLWRQLSASVKSCISSPI